MSLLVSPVVRPPHDASDLFSARRPSATRPGWTTPRAAFQSLLAGEATLVDVRSPTERADGALPTRLGVTIVDRDQLTRLEVDSAVIVLAGDDESAALTVRALQQRGVTSHALAGGLPAWRAAGMPLAE